MMRDLVFERWRADACEAVEDTMKMISLVDLYLPYFSLSVSDLRILVNRGLQQRSVELQEQKHVTMSWGTEVVDFLLSKVGIWIQNQSFVATRVMWQVRQIRWHGPASQCSYTLLSERHWTRPVACMVGCLPSGQDPL
jgi:hypothetical protein